MTMIQIQEAYIARVAAAWAKVGPRTKGHRFERSRRAARNEAFARLEKLGFSDIDARVVISDAHDMFDLERLAN